MPEKPTRTTRRDFLQGRSAAKAVGDLGRLAEPIEADARPGEPALEARSYLVQVGRRAMACQFEVLLNAGQHQAATEHAISALDLIDELEGQLSIYRHRSEVSQLNAVAQHRPVRVEARLFGLLQRAQQLYEQTDRAFDITSGPLIQIWRTAQRDGRLPPADVIRRALQSVGSDKLRLDPTHRSAQFLEAGVSIDLGAIGKGYALDRCADRLAPAGVADFMIHGGSSSILARGQRRSGTDRPGWTVGIQHPLRPDRRLLELQLCDRAVGTSGAGTHQFFVQGKRYGHILDPRTGYPVEGVLSATVVAPQAADSDALSTAFYVMGVESAQRYCAEHPEVAALITTPGRGPGAVELHAFNCESFAWRYVDEEP